MRSPRRLAAPKATTPLQDAAKLQRNARYLLKRLNEQFGAKPIFTREDCLHVAFTEVATITRYTYIRESLRFLIDEAHEVVEISNTELALKSNYRQAKRRQNLSYLATVGRLIDEHFRDAPFSLMDVLAVWTSDQLLTQNGKRVAVRGCLAHLVKEKRLMKNDDFTYEVRVAQPVQVQISA